MFVGPPGWSIAGLVIVFVLGIGGAIGGIIARAVVLRRGRLNPFVAEEQLQVKMSQGLDKFNAPQPPRKSIEGRLAELDDLHRRGIISDEELKAARANAIADG